MTEHKRGWSSGEKSDDKPRVWVPVIVPKPVFNGSDETRRYQDAVTYNPRREGEGIVEWMERVNAAARPVVMPEQRFPYREREPGEDE
jgi:hypothetical protein